jgi:hypothetical protein
MRAETRITPRSALAIAGSSRKALTWRWSPAAPPDTPACGCDGVVGRGLRTVAGKGCPRGSARFPFGRHPMSSQPRLRAKARFTIQPRALRGVCEGERDGGRGGGHHKRHRESSRRAPEITDSELRRRPTSERSRFVLLSNVPVRFLPAAMPQCAQRGLWMQPEGVV